MQKVTKTANSSAYSDDFPVNERCLDCDSPALLHVRGPASATHNGVTVTLHERPELQCQAGHVSTPDLAAFVRPAIFARLPAAKHHWRRGACCTACGTSLAMPARWTQLPVTVAYGTVLITVTLEIPATRCPECGVDHMPRAAADDVDTVIRHACAPEM